MNRRQIWLSDDTKPVTHLGAIFAACCPPPPSDLGKQASMSIRALWCRFADSDDPIRRSNLTSVACAEALPLCALDALEPR